jgi:hypothetical protein
MGPVARGMTKAMLAAALVAACGSGPVAVGPASPSPTAVAKASPRQSPSFGSPTTWTGSLSVSTTAAPAATPTPAAAATRTGTATHTPTATRSPAPTTTSLVPWLPKVDPAVASTFDIDTFVSPRVAVLPVSETPGGEPYRYDTGDPDPSTHPLMGFPQRAVLVVLHGPVLVEDVEWYLLTEARLAIDVPVGWAPASGPDGSQWLQPQAVDCPRSPMTIDELWRLSLTDGLPVCYGTAEVAISGDLTCSPEVDTFVVGASWLQGGRCSFGPPPSVYGLASDLPDGRYEVTGHFSDRETPNCRSADGVSSELERLAAVLHCRRAFVATSATLVSP